METETKAKPPRAEKPKKAEVISITFIGDPMDGKKKVTGYRVFKRWSDEAEEEVTIRKPIVKTHKADDPDTITMFGMTFDADNPVEVKPDSEWWREYGPRILGNHHFRVEGVKGNHEYDAESAAAKAALADVERRSIAAD